MALQRADKGAASGAEDGSETWGDSPQPTTAPVGRNSKAVVPVLPPVRNHHLNALSDTAVVLENSSCLLYMTYVAMLVLTYATLAG